jgi:MFS family permease
VSPLVRLGAAAGCSNLADGMFQIALPLVALGITEDPGAFAAVTLVMRLPWLLFALPAGAFADRLDRRRTMTLVNLARVALIGTLAAVVAAGHERLWILYVIGFALGVGETLFDTASQSILPAMVDDKDRLATANGRLYAVEMATNQFVGPPLGGLIAAVSLALALTGSAVAYLLAALALTTIAGSFRTERSGPPTRLRTDIAEGVRYVFGDRLLRTLALCVGLSNLASTAAFSLFPLYAVGDDSAMGLSKPAFGVLLTAMAVGMLVMAPFVDRIEGRFGTFPALLVAISLFPLMSLGPAATAAWGPIALAFAATGVSNVVWNVLTVSLRQRITPDHLLGRMNSAYRLLAWGTMPLGAGVGGILGEAIGLRGAFWVATALSAACVPLFLSGVSPAAIARARADAEERDAAPALA